MKFFAYVDPGLGALLWQTVVAGVVGFLFYLKKTRRWIVDGIRKIFGRARQVEPVVTEVTVTDNKLAPKIESKTEAR
ncbi:MAG TPA: hypothetical protein VMB80_09125 [Candidatus Acidoferrum sp.]|nr:hypothetical protein [Candidatus Acidoferrum sp.]